MTADNALAAKPIADPAWPKLRPLVLSALRQDLELVELGIGSDDNSNWSGLIEGLRRDQSQKAVLIRVTAWGLGEEDLLWWALLSARFEEAVSERQQLSRALVMAERWLREREEKVRYEAFALAQAEPKPTPGTLAAYAVFTAGPSLAPMDEKLSPAPPWVPRSAAQAALVAAAAAPAMAATGHGFEAVNFIGLEIAAGRDGRAAARRALNAVGSSKSGDHA